MAPDRLTRRSFVASLVAGAGLAGCSAPDSTHVGARDPASSTDRDQLTDPNTSGDNAYSRVYRETIDSVVLVRVYVTGGTGQGSGFVFGDGHVVTNQHVVAGASEIEIRFNRGEWRSATVAGTDAYSDLAILSLPDLPEYVDPLPLTAEDVFVGQRVLALGHPFGFASSLSTGVVSGVNRVLPAPNGFTIPVAVQTTAAVNPGNSGGPLVTLDGDVAGVVSSGAGEGVGFAIGVPLLERVVPRLVEEGEYSHPYLGVRLVEVTPLVASANDLTDPNGILVASVVPDGPTDGVLQGSDERVTLRGQQLPVGGDVIVGIDGRELRSLGGLSTYLALQTSPGDEVEVAVLRDGERRSVEVVLGTRPSPEGLVQPA